MAESEAADDDVGVFPLFCVSRGRRGVAVELGEGNLGITR